MNHIQEQIVIVDDIPANLHVLGNLLKTNGYRVCRSEKMSALGNLVAGITHEINNPVGFISGNLVQAQQTSPQG